MRHLPVLIPILPLASAMLCLVLSRINKNLGKYVVLGALTASLASSIGVFIDVMRSGKTIHYYMGNWQPPIGIEFVIDQMNAIMEAVANWVTDNGCEFDGPAFNIYHVSPHETSDPNEFVTEVCYPVRRK